MIQRASVALSPPERAEDQLVPEAAPGGEGDPPAVAAGPVGVRPVGLVGVRAAEGPLQVGVRVRGRAAWQKGGRRRWGKRENGERMSTEAR